MPAYLLGIVDLAVKTRVDRFLYGSYILAWGHGQYSYKNEHR
jgi:hypothetical protein